MPTINSGTCTVISRYIQTFRKDNKGNLLRRKFQTQESNYC